MTDYEPIHVYVPGAQDDPRSQELTPNGIVIHRGPPLHPDDLAIVNGLPCTSMARTLIDLAEVCDRDELLECFANALERGLLTREDFDAARARVEWRPSLAMLDEVVAQVDWPKA